eukprot:gnl/TRDRNA2_/TRDRNA2_175230_c1_seq2.p1 gnl/TRDRNA2_/TRDRNA2_175230_c1~~gnl/TRDRNA2_/TRDRNA2_175230_c1_seq2.p1  ORF type:complete len:211 (+),score=14.82 gnl/TRDRNA2_/TRDRNA2_175230_c1_seq2:1-633(+)
MIGVSIMGERVPYNECDNSGISVLMEQDLDEVGHLTIAKGGMQATIQPVPEIVEVSAWESVSASASTRRRRPRRSNDSCDTSSVTNSTALTMDSQTGEVPEEAELVRQMRTPYSPPWKESFEVDYLESCTQGALEDLMRTFNHGHVSCCNWHAAVNRLMSYLSVLKSRRCDDAWPALEPSWQCNQCSAMQFEDEDEVCELCRSSRDQDDG